MPRSAKLEDSAGDHVRFDAPQKAAWIFACIAETPLAYVFVFLVYIIALWTMNGMPTSEFFGQSNAVRDSGRVWEGNARYCW